MAATSAERERYKVHEAQMTTERQRQFARVETNQTWKRKIPMFEELLWGRVPVINVEMANGTDSRMRRPQEHWLQSFRPRYLGESGAA